MSQPSHHPPDPHATPTRTHAACAPSPRPPRPCRHTRSVPRRVAADPVQHGPARDRGTHPSGLPAQPHLGPPRRRPPPLPGRGRPAGRRRRGRLRPGRGRPRRGTGRRVPAGPPGGHLLGRPHGPERRTGGLRGTIRTCVRHLSGRGTRRGAPGPGPRRHPVTIGQRSRGGAPGGRGAAAPPGPGPSAPLPQGRRGLRDQPL